jgi:hypothetical protein
MLKKTSTGHRKEYVGGASFIPIDNPFSTSSIASGSYHGDSVLITDLPH